MNAPSFRIRVDLSSSVPAYRQIVDEFRILLIEGILTPGTVLPSVRRLAVDLGVHFNTVAEAYRILGNEGWVDVSHGRNVRVVERSAPAGPTEEDVRIFRQRIRQLVAEMRAQGWAEDRIAQEFSANAERRDPR